MTLKEDGKDALVVDFFSLLFFRALVFLFFRAKRVAATLSMCNNLKGAENKKVTSSSSLIFKGLR